MTTYRGTLFLLRWRKYCLEYGLGKDDDYVFARYNGKMMTFATTDIIFVKDLLQITSGRM